MKAAHHPNPRFARCATAPGRTWFFTFNLTNRHANLLVRRIDDLCGAVEVVKAHHRFSVAAMMVLSENLHAV